MARAIEGELLFIGVYVDDIVMARAIEGELLFIGVYVDDILMATKSKTRLTDVRQSIAS